MSNEERAAMTVFLVLGSCLVVLTCFTISLWMRIQDLETQVWVLKIIDQNIIHKIGPLVDEKGELVPPLIQTKEVHP